MACQTWVMIRQILKTIIVSGLVVLSVLPVAAQDAGVSCFQMPLGQSLHSFLSGKRPCLGGRAPLLEMETRDLLDMFDQRVAHKDLLIERPLQGRAGLLMKIDEQVEFGAAYRFTTTKNVRVQWFNHMMPLHQELPGHVAVLRVKISWR